MSSVHNTCLRFSSAGGRRRGACTASGSSLSGSGANVQYHAQGREFCRHGIAQDQPPAFCAERMKLYRDSLTPRLAGRLRFSVCASGSHYARHGRTAWRHPQVWSRTWGQWCRPRRAGQAGGEMNLV